MRLGDLQRNAMRILNIAMRCLPFEQLASLQGVSVIDVGPCTSQVGDLRSFVTVDKAAARAAAADRSHR